MTLPNLIVITGPTAVGKSSLAIELAKKLDSEIINADSVQVYKGFDIGSGKVTEKEMQSVPHHLLSYVEANQKFDMARFCKDAEAKIKELNKKNKIPIVCGGTGMYLRALVNGMVEIPKIKKEALLTLENSKKEAYDFLLEIDPKAAASVDRADTQRIKRAILVFLSFGKSIIDFQKEHNYQDVKFNTLFIILSEQKESLNMKINSRCKEMLELGLVKEVIHLLNSYSLSCNAFNAIGYRHIVGYLRADYSFDRMLELLKRDTRRFAKRQKTWWRNQPRFLNWQNVSEEFNSSNINSVESKEVCELSNLAQFVEGYFLDSKNKISYIDINNYDRL